MLIIVWHEYSKLKLISDKDVNFFRKKTISAPKVETLRMARYIQILWLSTLYLTQGRIGPTALRAVGPWLKFIMFSSAYLPSLEIIFESSQKDPYSLDFL